MGVLVAAGTVLVAAGAVLISWLLRRNRDDS